MGWELKREREIEKQGAAVSKSLCDYISKVRKKAQQRGKVIRR